MPKGVYLHAHIKPKTYPTEMVAEVQVLYEEGHTQTEIAEKLGTTQKVVWKLMQNHGIQARVAAKRDQAREKNSYWRGDDAGYKAFHKRVEAARGTPQHCSACETVDAPRFHWANLTGRYEEIYDYVRLCAACHSRLDAHRRRVTGRLTSLIGGGALCLRT